ncbi:hypothetical protein VIGAN_UM015100 [Vigna angularis var. angularis]|uniref:Uncharacterized protein n=1 Tax=Vigna angularis var. angularis TaxID=157739 RepID=A0A0S3TDI5_PHAAN|nr:hypothetical protein VIGAN_UM015100 [Vigna angularis var. angularis]
MGRSLQGERTLVTWRAQARYVASGRSFTENERPSNKCEEDARSARRGRSSSAAEDARPEGGHTAENARPARRGCSSSTHARPEMGRSSAEEGARPGGRGRSSALVQKLDARPEIGRSSTKEPVTQLLDFLYKAESEDLENQI